MQSYSRLPMTVTVAISPMRLDFNDLLKIDRRWPDYDGWGRVKEEVKYVKNQAAEQETETQPQITRIYWKDADGKEIQNLPDQGVATLCAITENTSAGDTLQFEVELSEGDFITVSGTVDDSGLVEIQNVNLGSEK